jgi:osmotically-inducible protein OsmY
MQGQPDGQGRHRGKGPRNYNRSDMRIKEDINDLLVDDPYVDATDVDVSVQNGEVIINGIVNDRNMKRRVEDVIESVKGITHFENRLRTRIPGGRITGIHNSEKA